MAQDNLTYAFIIIAITLSLVALMLAVNNRKTERKMRTMARHLSLMQRSEAAHELCKRINKISPELCAGLDYTLKESGDDVEIDQWNSHHPKPGS